MVKAMSLAFLSFLIAIVLPNGLELGKEFGILQFIGVFGAFALLAFALSCVFTALALSVKSIDSLVAIVNFATFPLVFTSTALFPEAGFPGWLSTISNVNPITWATDSARLLMVHGSGLSTAQLSSLTSYGSYLIGFALVMAAIGYLAAEICACAGLILESVQSPEEMDSIFMLSSMLPSFQSRNHTLSRCSRNLS